MATLTFQDNITTTIAAGTSLAAIVFNEWTTSDGRQNTGIIYLTPK